jgi:hypothetical protein
MTVTNKVHTSYGIGTLADRMEPDWITVRLPINELTRTIPADRVVTQGENMGLFKFHIEELK